MVAMVAAVVSSPTLLVPVDVVSPLSPVVALVEDAELGPEPRVIPTLAELSPASASSPEQAVRSEAAAMESATIPATGRLEVVGIERARFMISM